MPGFGRLRTKKDFRRLFKEGKVRSNRALAVRFLANEEGVLRLAFSMRKKTAGSVQRNRLKRVLYEELRKRAPEVAGAFDLLILPREEALKLSSHSLRQSFRRLLFEIGVLLTNENH